MQEYEQEVSKVSVPRVHFIDGLRALAALFVMICHAFFEPANGYYNSRIMNHLGLTYGHISVDVFIVLSGFCLMLPVLRKGLGPLPTFFQKRARRILPPYYGALILTILYIIFAGHFKTGTVWDNSLPLTWQQIAAHLLLVHDLPIPIPGGSINYPMWSIAVECQLYLLMPLIVLSLGRIGNTLTLTLAIIVGLLIHYATQGKLDSATPWYLGLFALGAVAARITSRPLNCYKTLRLLCTLLWVVILSVIAIKGKIFFETFTPIIDTMIGGATAILLIVTMEDSGQTRHPLTRFLSWPPLVKIGIFSYSLYLVHAPFLHILDRCYARILSPSPEVMFLLLVCSTPLIVVAAYLFHLVFEKPFMKSPSRILAYPLASEPSLRSTVPLELP